MNKDIQGALLRHCARFIRKSLDPINKRLDDMETKALEVPLDGIVKELLTADELKTLVDLHVAEAVTKHFEANPIRHGEKGEPGTKGEPGQNGEDGVGLAGAVIDRDGELVVTKTNGEAIRLGQVVGKNGAPGANGKDGADFTDVEFDYDGERSLTIRGRGGEIVKRLPIPIDRGYWREGFKAEKSDVVTHNGSAWIALKDTDAKPGIANDSEWRMLARKGKDGDPGAPGKAYVPPSPIKLGESNG